LEVNYRDSNGRCVVVLFKCDWFEPIQGVRVNRKHNLVDIKYKSKGCQNDPFILASQAEQVYYAPYPSMTKDLKDWWAVVKATPRSIYEVTQFSSEIVDDNVDVEEFFQENEMPTCSNTTDANENTEIEEVGDLDVGDAYMEDANYDNGSRSEGRGRGISGNIGIGGSSSNVSGFGNQEDANYDNGSRSGGRGRGISGNIGIGGSSSSNVSGFGNQEDSNYDNGSRSGGRGKGICGNIGIGRSSNVSEFVDQDVDYDYGRS
ncbi:putative transposon, En/Spm-like, transposase-associated domain protein, partial [Tanacetum coccineum]